MLGPVLFALLGAALARPPQAVASSFNENLARGKMYALMAAWFGGDPQTCASNHGLGQVDKTVTVKCDLLDSDTCFAFTGVSHADKAVYVSFRGTIGSTQMLMEFLETLFTQQSTFSAGGKVAKYFNDAFNLMWTGGVKESLLRLTRANPGYDVWITGHSLGASVGVLCAAYLSSTGVVPAEKLQVYTYGEPRTGNKDFAQAVQRLVPNTFRITHNRDLIVQLPPTLIGYYHHATEVYYHNKMAVGDAYIVCPGSESAQCSSGHLDISMNDHLTYYDKVIEDYGKAGCQ